ncbi:hypothetical protein F5Y18DRAFT_135297 [Xylariaceae sp. FL1019]|nr:hypothetical protein F5Y18DRAFT_135297 [Xylariaceae sp. FL1019]
MNLLLLRLSVICISVHTRPTSNLARDCSCLAGRISSTDKKTVPLSRSTSPPAGETRSEHDTSSLSTLLSLLVASPALCSPLQRSTRGREGGRLTSDPDRGQLIGRQSPPHLRLYGRTGIPTYRAYYLPYTKKTPGGAPGRSSPRRSPASLFSYLSCRRSVCLSVCQYHKDLCSIRLVLTSAPSPQTWLVCFLKLSNSYPYRPSSALVCGERGTGPLGLDAVQTDTTNSNNTNNTHRVFFRTHSLAPGTSLRRRVASRVPVLHLNAAAGIGEHAYSYLTA